MTTITDNQTSRPNYSVKNIEMVVKGSDVVARIFTLAVGDTIPWHYHSESHDHYFVLQGEVTLSTRDPDTRTIVPVGGHHQIAPGTRHLVSNGGGIEARFLLIQGVGKYDWLKA